MVVLCMQQKTLSTISFHVYLCKVALTNQLCDLVGSQEIPQHTKLFEAVNPLISDHLVAHEIFQIKAPLSQPQPAFHSVQLL